jgi:MFS family permease
MTTEGAPARPSAISLPQTVVLAGTLGFVYILSQFLRNSIGVIAPDLATELGLSASEIGVLSSVFFFCFASAQIPLGVALDRYGPRNCMLVCAVVAISGALLFAAAPSPFWLVTARILMGFGSCCYLMAPLALYARKFPPDRFATLVGIQVGLGTMGTLMATAPFALAVAAIGWRGSFVVIAGAIALAALGIALVVRASDGMVPGAKVETLRESLAGMVEATKVPSFWRLFVMQLTCYSSFVLVVGLWGGPYLTHIYGYSLTERGNMLLLAVVAQVIGSFLWGPADRLFKSYKVPVLLGCLTTAAAMGAAAIFGTFPAAGLFAWFLIIGGSTACFTVLIAHGKSLFPPRLVGRGLVLLNVAAMGGAFLSQTLTGRLIDLFPQVGDGYALDAYRAIFAFQCVSILLGSLIYLSARDPRAKPSESA